MIPSRSLPFAKTWVLGAAFLNCTGWLLSVLGQLNTVGYCAALVLGLALFLGFGREVWGDFRWQPSLGKLKWRCAHWLPALFLLFAVLAAIGGILYAPNNYDGLTYRFPRVLHWMAEHRWHWISTCEDRMNYSATGFEWLMAPLFALTESDRFFFLINLVSYALLPGLTFATFSRLGVGKRMAWCWMWLLPCGYGFVMQAASIGNDTFSVVYLLASLCFALKFRETGRASDFWISMIAAALLTGAKASNLPLLLPWALAALPALRLLKTRPLSFGFVLLICVMSSFAPIGWLNIKHTGDWTGDPADVYKMKLAAPLYGVVGNSLQILTQNLMPPVMPWCNVWNENVEIWKTSPSFQPLLENFPRLSLGWGELEQEEAAGLGLGLTALLAVTFFAGLRRRPESPTFSGRKLGILVCLGGWVALLVYMAKMGSESAPRLIFAYYPLLAASVLLLPGAAGLARKRWWKTFACLAALSALPSLVLTPSRPLWPAVTVCKKLVCTFPDSVLFNRFYTAYRVYRDRSDNLAPLRAYLSKNDKTVGFMSFDDSEVSLWKPFASRRVVALTPANQNAFSRASWRVVLNKRAFQATFGQPFEQWLATTGGWVVGREMVTTKIAAGPQEWCVIEFANGGSTPQ